jgi:DNA polymerase-3 subunit alpha
MENAQNAQFVHLHVHSAYSLLDGAARIDELVSVAASYGSPAIALTDHGNLHGALALIKSCTEKKIKPIVGIEAYLAPRGIASRGERDDAHLTLLAMNEEGYRNLCRLSTISWRDGFYYKPRIDIELLEQHNAGLICLSGCLSGTVASPLVRGDYARAREGAQAYQAIFGDRFYLEIMRHGLPDQEKILEDLRRLGTELGASLVGTNDCHYVHAHDCELHDALLCIGTSKKLSDPARMRFDTAEFYLKSPADMRALFHDFPEACDNTLEIAERVNLEFSKGKQYHIPSFPIPDNTPTERSLGRKPTDAEYLRALVRAGLKRRYGADAAKQEILDRMEFELKTIEEMGFASYFLIVWDFVRYARSRGIPVGPGRGSAVGSIVSYCLAITSLDPIAHGLYFERFLNPSRISMPDIDTDFCIEGRSVVIDYVTEKYGADRVAGIATFQTIATKNALRDAARVLDLPPALADKVCKVIPSGPRGPANITEARFVIPEIEEMGRLDDRIGQILELATRIEGFTRGTGTHAAAIVIGERALTEYLPLYRPKDSEALNTQFEMGEVESLGLLKMDFLGLRNLTVIRDACAAIRASSAPEFSIEAIPMDDAATFAMIARGETSGIFQLEGEGMKRAIALMKPDRFGDIVSLVALYRPGPMDLIPQYCRVKRGEAKPDYLHPALAPILDETYSVAIFQEQIMRIAQEIAGFSLADADNLRKIMGKKQVEKIAAEREKFVAGAIAQGVAENVARAVFAFIEPFAGYGFCKSHAVAYAWVSYQTAYLKTHFPREYLAALMTSVADKAEKFIGYARDAQAAGLRLLAPDVNHSQIACSVEGDAIRLGFGVLRGAAVLSAAALIQERARGGRYSSLPELVERVRASGLQRATLEILIKAGACDSLGGHRAQLIGSLDNAFACADQTIRDQREGRLDLFAELNLGTPVLPSTAPASLSTMLAWEYESLGLYLSGDPTAPLHHVRDQRYGLPIASLARGERRWVAGAVSDVVGRTTRSGKAMLNFRLSDATGSIDCLMFGDTVARYRDVVKNSAIVLGLGAAQADARSEDPEGGPLSLFIDEIVTAEQLERMVA